MTILEFFEKLKAKGYVIPPEIGTLVVVTKESQELGLRLLLEADRKNVYRTWYGEEIAGNGQPVWKNRLGMAQDDVLDGDPDTICCLLGSAS